jgi:hypothetical protein
MSGPDTPTTALTFERLPDLRARTEKISTMLRDQLSAHLETLRPILSPERLFGRTPGAKTETPLADRSLAQLQHGYRQFATRPFDLPAELDQYWLGLVGNRVALYPWEYTHPAGPEARTITMTSPVRWVMSFTSGYTLSQFRHAVVGGGERQPEHVRQFVVNALVMQLVLASTPGLAALFADLRYEVHTFSAPDLPKLPLTVVTSALGSFRPSDELIVAATNFSGIPAFIELIDVDGLPRLQDPLRTRIEARLR